MIPPVCIRAEKVSKNFGRLDALKQVSLEIGQGECVALVGPNGAGKSTMFKLCLGLIEPSGGEINVLGRTPSTGGFDEARRRIGFLPEQVLFHGALTGRETLRFYVRLKRAAASEVAELLARVRLSDAADRRVATYSKGMRQRLGLAQALIGGPRLLLLDEPTSGLDPEARQNFFRIIDEEKQKGAAVVLSSHILTELEARTDRIAILNRGRLMANASISELIRRLSLPSRISVRAAGRQMERLTRHFAGRFAPACFVNGAAILDCPPDEKLALLKELMSGELAFDGLDIAEPSLEQVFAAYTSGERGQ